MIVSETSGLKRMVPPILCEKSLIEKHIRRLNILSGEFLSHNWRGNLNNHRQFSPLSMTVSTQKAQLDRNILGGGDVSCNYVVYHLLELNLVKF